MIYVRRLQQEMLVDYDPVTLSVIPMFHGYGVLLLLKLLVTGGRIINLKKFNQEQFLTAIEKYQVYFDFISFFVFLQMKFIAICISSQVTDLALVPALMIFLSKHPLVNNYDLSSVRNISCGSAPLSLEIENEMKAKLKLDKIIKGYGMTETTILCTYAPPGIEMKPGSVGKLLPGLLAKVYR